MDNIMLSEQPSELLFFFAFSIVVCMVVCIFVFNLAKGTFSKVEIFENTIVNTFCKELTTVYAEVQDIKNTLSDIETELSVVQDELDLAKEQIKLLNKIVNIPNLNSRYNNDI